MLDYQQQSDWEPVQAYFQSPIDIRSAEVKARTAALTMDYKTPLRLTSVENLGNNLHFHGQGQVEILQRPYHLKQVHFHHPAEHLLEGKAPAVEVHVVFANAIGQTLVLALLYQLGHASKLIQQLQDQRLDQFDLALPHSGVAYHYLGSLTTPPLQPGIEWLVLASSELTLSPTQLAWFKHHFPTNARAVQPLQQRTIERLKL